MIDPISINNNDYRRWDLNSGLLDDQKNEINNNTNSFSRELKSIMQKNIPEDQIGIIDCNQLYREAKSSSKNDQEAEEQLNVITQNIMNADRPGYKRVLPQKNNNGEYITDNTAGRLIKSNNTLDIAISGDSKGIKLNDGTYQRSISIMFNKQGHPITHDKQIPLQIKHAPNTDKDWSYRHISIDKQGKVMDKNNGEYLGEIIFDKTKNSLLAQGYQEASNVNVPLEMIRLNNYLRNVEMQRAMYTIDTSLDKESLNIAKSS